MVGLMPHPERAMRRRCWGRPTAWCCCEALLGHGHGPAGVGLNAGRPGRLRRPAAPVSRGCGGSSALARAAALTPTAARRVRDALALAVALATLTKAFSRAPRCRRLVRRGPVRLAQAAASPRTRWRRVSGSALGSRFVDGGQPLLDGFRRALASRPGPVDSSASRYRRTARPSSRPFASASLCAFDMDDLRRFGWGRIRHESQCRSRARMRMQVSVNRYHRR